MMASCHRRAASAEPAEPADLWRSLVLDEYTVNQEKILGPSGTCRAGGQLFYAAGSGFIQSPENTLERMRLSPPLRITVVRRPSEVVLKASTAVWRQVRELLASSGKQFSELRVPLTASASPGSGAATAPTSLLVAIRPGGLLHRVCGDEAWITGSLPALEQLLENVDCPSPFDGAHHHSGPELPWVEPGSENFVFMHIEEADAL